MCIRDRLYGALLAREEEAEAIFEEQEEILKRVTEEISAQAEHVSYTHLDVYKRQGYA